MSSFFIIIIFILYKIFRSSFLNGSSIGDDSGRGIPNIDQYFNSIAAPVIMVARMSSNPTREKQSEVNYYIQNVIIPTYFNDLATRHKAYSVFAKYTRIDRETLINLVKNAGDTIIRTSPSTYYKKTLLKHLFEICSICDGMNTTQRDFIESFARKIGVSARQTYDEYMSENSGSYDWHNHRSSYDQNTNDNYSYGYERTANKTSAGELEKAYKTLGVDENATDEEIKTRKNKLLRKWHPDLYAQQGEEAIKKATLNSQKINEAYDIIKEHRGFN